MSWLSRRPVLVRRMDKATKAIDELLRLLIGVGVLALSVVLVTQIVYQIAVSPFDSADRTFAKKGLRHWKEVACGAAIFVVSVGTICAMIAGAWKNRNTKEES
ncbi:MAG: hypothetical protein KDD53_08815 [Bdellovibrionales bacterium]|nr:hypothetical protein [Bdellovibrionales bacterium]